MSAGHDLKVSGWIVLPALPDLPAASKWLSTRSRFRRPAVSTALMSQTTSRLPTTVGVASRQSFPPTIYLGGRTRRSCGLWRRTTPAIIISGHWHLADSGLITGAVTVRCRRMLSRRLTLIGNSRLGARRGPAGPGAGSVSVTLVLRVIAGLTGPVRSGRIAWMVTRVVRAVWTAPKAGPSPRTGVVSLTPMSVPNRMTRTFVDLGGIRASGPPA